METENQNLRVRSETASGEKDGEMEDSVVKINTHTHTKFMFILPMV